MWGEVTLCPVMLQAENEEATRSLFSLDLVRKRLRKMPREAICSAFSLSVRVHLMRHPLPKLEATFILDSDASAVTNPISGYPYSTVNTENTAFKRCIEKPRYNIAEEGETYDPI